MIRDVHGGAAVQTAQGGETRAQAGDRPPAVRTTGTRTQAPTGRGAAGTSAASAGLANPRRLRLR